MTDLTQIYGSRGRVGLILPADNVCMEPEIYSLNIPGVSFNALRLTATDHHEMREQAVALSSTIYELGLDAIIYACAETSFNDGSDTSKRITDILVEKSQLPIATATDTMLSALEAVGAENLAVLTPYSKKSGDDLETTLATQGFNVVSSRHRDFFPDSDDPREWFATNRQPLDITIQLLDEMDISEADTILIASTNWATIAAIPELEAKYSKPVISSNQSILWWLAQTLDFSLSENQLGMLGAKLAREVSA